MKPVLFLSLVFTALKLFRVNALPSDLHSGKKIPVNIHSLAYHEDLDVHHLHMSRDGVDHHFKLRRPTSAEVVFHPSMTITQVFGNGTVDDWSPDQKTLESANDVHIDPISHAVLRLEKTAGGNHKITGITRDFSIHHDEDTSSHYSHDHASPTCHYKQPAKMNSNSNFSAGVNSPSAGIKGLGEPNTPAQTKPGVLNTVEFLLFTDYDLSERFGFDRTRVLNYYTPIMYDLNLRYLTLPSVQVTFVLSQLVVNTDRESQPYVEWRDAQGQRNMGSCLARFTEWLQENRGKFSKHDVAAIATKTFTEGGVANGDSVCQNNNMFAYTDEGHWSSPVFLAHEAGHTLGAPHDRDPDDCNKNEDHYIMQGGHNGKVWFFSTCSDKYISRVLRDKDCLRRRDNNRPERVNFQNPKAPSIDDVCKAKLNNDRAFVAKEDQENCEIIQCRSPDSDGVQWAANNNIENMICNSGKGRCVRGFCRTEGYFFKNVASGLCLQAENRFTYSSSLHMVPCPDKKDQTPLDQFVVRVGRHWTTLETPYSQIDDRGHLDKGDKCMELGPGESDRTILWTDRCGSYANDWHAFELVDAGKGRFVIRHKVTRRCVQPENGQKGAKVYGYKNCNTKNEGQLWTRYHS